MNIYQTILDHAHQVLPHQLVVEWLKDYRRPNDKIKSLKTEGLLQTIKKGLYIAGPVFKIKPDSFLLANHIFGPSYVSMETALSHYGFIPERVYEITSMTTKTSKTFNTKAGRFTYISLPLPYYTYGITGIQFTDNQWGLIACREKALTDKIVATKGLLFRSTSACHDFLIENMRIDENYLKELNTREIISWLPHAPKQQSLAILIKTIEKL